MKVEIYSDVACPWCYVGDRRFESALASFDGAGDVDVEYKPFQLDPSAPAAGVPLGEYLQRRFGRPVDDMLGRVTENAVAEGIDIHWNEAIAANTRNAHRLLGLALREYGAPVQRELLRRLFDAHFTRGANVASVDVLSDLAEAAGMDRARAQAYLSSDEGSAELDRELRAAAMIGVSSVPTFVFDGQYAVEGAQPTAVFLQALEEVRKRSANPVESQDV